MSCDGFRLFVFEFKSQNGFKLFFQTLISHSNTILVLNYFPALPHHLQYNAPRCQGRSHYQIKQKIKAVEGLKLPKVFKEKLFFVKGRKLRSQICQNQKFVINIMFYAFSSMYCISLAINIHIIQHRIQPLGVLFIYLLLSLTSI